MINYYHWTFFVSLLYNLTNRFYVVMPLFSNRSQKTSKCGKNITNTLACGLSAAFLFLPHVDLISDLQVQYILHVVYYGTDLTAIWNKHVFVLGIIIVLLTVREKNC